MNFRDILTRVKGLLAVKIDTKKYFTYATIIIAILGVIGIAISRSTNEKLRANLAKVESERNESNKLVTDALAQIQNAKIVMDMNAGLVSDLHGEIDSSREEIERLSENLNESRGERDTLETLLEETHTELSGNKLKNSFIGEKIVEGLEAHFPEAGHLFFSETQVNLFRTNPVTANLIYTVITENAVRVQLIENLGGQVTILAEQVEQTENIVSLRGEEIAAMQNVNDEYQRTQENLEAALSQDRRYIDTLERQIALMSRKNLFERILPSLNVVVGPYYDPFRNTGGVGVSLGLGWRF